MMQLQILIQAAQEVVHKALKEIREIKAIKEMQVQMVNLHMKFGKKLEILEMKPLSLNHLKVKREMHLHMMISLQNNLQL